MNHFKCLSLSLPPCIFIHTPALFTRVRLTATVVIVSSKETQKAKYNGG